jgi:transcription-repair coupling factor (superfamily II helicase)
MDDAPDRGESRAPQLQDVLDLCAALNREGARYVLIGGFAVILHGFVRSTKDVDLLVDPSEENIRAVKRAMSTLPDNAAALLADDEVLQYKVVRIADEIVVDLLAAACGVTYPEAAESGIETFTVNDVKIPVASKQILIRMKNTIRESDALDVRFLHMRIDEEGKGRR